MHLTSTGFLAGTSVLNFMFGSSNQLREEPGYKAVHAVAGIVLLLSGIINWILIKKGKQLKGSQNVWRHALEFKFLLSMLLTPLINPIARWMYADDETDQQNFKTTIQFGLVVFMLIGSILLKSFREDFCHNFLSHPFEDKLSQIEARVKQMASKTQDQP